MVSLLAEHGIEAVVHLAFVLSPGHSRAAAQRINVGGAASVLDACHHAGVRHILCLSSSTVYGAHPDNPPMLTEDSPMRPVGGFQYGEDKTLVEMLIRDFNRRHPEVATTVLRACPVMGPNADNFVTQAFSKPFLVGIKGCDPPMQFLHEDDLTEVMTICLLRGAVGVYNLAGEGTITWSEAASIFGRKLVYLPAPLLYGLTGASWNLRLQSDSPACGLDFIRYRWTVSTEKVQRELDVQFKHSSKEAWEAFAARERPHPRVV
jgi:UDP-glucose 4-epimerase